MLTACVDTHHVETHESLYPSSECACFLALKLTFCFDELTRNPHKYKNDDENMINSSMTVYKIYYKLQPNLHHLSLIITTVNSSSKRQRQKAK